MLKDSSEISAIFFFTLGFFKDCSRDQIYLLYRSCNLKNNFINTCKITPHYMIWGISKITTLRKSNFRKINSNNAANQAVESIYDFFLSFWEMLGFPYLILQESQNDLLYSISYNIVRIYKFLQIEFISKDENKSCILRQWTSFSLSTISHSVVSLTYLQSTIVQIYLMENSRSRQFMTFK